MQFPHQFGGDAAPRRDARPQVFETRICHLTPLEEFQLGEEHGGDAVQGRAVFLLHRLQRGFGIECFAGEDDRGSMRCACHVAEDGAETVEEGGRTADYVARGEEHAVADGGAVV